MEDVLILDATHSDYPNQRWVELKFRKTQTVGDAKRQLMKHMGTTPGTLKLYAYDPFDETDKSGVYLENDSATLASYGLESGMSLHVVDTDQNSISKQLYEASLEYSKAEEGRKFNAIKFKLSDESYERRMDSARHFLRNLRRQQPELFQKRITCTLLAEQQDKLISDFLDHYKPKLRCELRVPAVMRGEILYAGLRQSASKKGYWVAVLLDEPFGQSEAKDLEQLGNSDLNPKYIRWIRVPLIRQEGPIDPFELDEI